MEITKSSDIEFKNKIKQRILGLIERDGGDFEKSDFYKFCEGADPQEVDICLEELRRKSIINLKINKYYIRFKKRKKVKWDLARALTISKIYEKLPEENKFYSQWWFTPETLYRASLKLYDIIPQKSIAFLGTPTLAFLFYVATKKKTYLFEADREVIKVIKRGIGEERNFSIINYDVREEMRANYKNKFDIVFFDPPWYPPFVEMFIYRAIELVKNNGHIATSLPGLLTRPQEPEARKHLLNLIIGTHSNIVSLEKGLLNYQIPSFENAAFTDTIGIVEDSWRSADLLIAETAKKKKNIEKPRVWKEDSFITFKKKDKGIRFFLKRQSKADKKEKVLKLIFNKKFKNNVSRRKMSFEDIDLWTSKNDGYKVKGYAILETILRCWSRGYNANETRQRLHRKFLMETRVSKECVRIAKEKLCIWADSESTIVLRFPAIKLEERRRIYPRIASVPTSAKKRLYDKIRDSYRGEFQRDRDRVLWSEAFKKLAGKTQMLPWEGASEIRNRLSHTIEVTELASTFARIFRLNEDLTQAIAFAHDIGHPPFGHAGEMAINAFFQEISKNKIFFNHYEQALDLVNYIEIPYLSEASGEYFGLDLHREVQEGIFKHMYHFGRCKEKNDQRDIYINSKHKEIFKNDFCHLEGQAVRLADKIAYMVEDLEDGIKAGILSIRAISQASLFKRPSTSFSDRDINYDSPIETFVAKRRNILKLFMENTIEETKKRIGKKNIEEIRSAKDYCFAIPENLKREHDEIWNSIEVRILHNNERITRANALSFRVISFLLNTISLKPNMVSLDWVKRYEKLMHSKQKEYINWYERVLGKKVEISFEGKRTPVATWQVILAKDYVVSLTDNSALFLYKQLSAL